MRTFKNYSLALILGAVFLASVSIAGTAEADEGTRRNEGLHLIAGMVIGSAITAYTESPTKGVVAGVTAGVLKELADHESESHTASIKDVAVTALGAIAGSYVTGLIITPGAISYRWKW